MGFSDFELHRVLWQNCCGAKGIHQGAEDKYVIVYNRVLVYIYVCVCVLNIIPTAL